MMTDKDLISRAAAIETLKSAGDSAVTEALGQRLCCSGHHCGCEGSTVEDYLVHLIAALPEVQALVGQELADALVGLHILAGQMTCDQWMMFARAVYNNLAPGAAGLAASADQIEKGEGA